MRFIRCEPFDDEDLSGQLSSPDSHATGGSPLYRSWPSFADRPSGQDHERARGRWSRGDSLTGSCESKLAELLQANGFHVRIGPREERQLPFLRVRNRISNRNRWFGIVHGFRLAEERINNLVRDLRAAGVSRLLVNAANQILNGESKNTRRALTWTETKNWPD